MPGRTRTCDPLLRRQVLYPAELRAHSVKKLVGARGFEPPTPRSQTECATTAPRPDIFKSAGFPDELRSDILAYKNAFF